MRKIDFLVFFFLTYLSSTSPSIRIDNIFTMYILGLDFFFQCAGQGLAKPSLG